MGEARVFLVVSRVFYRSFIRLKHVLNTLGIFYSGHSAVGRSGR